MKLIMALLLLACMQATAGSFAQKITLSAEKVSLEKVFTAIKQQTGYLFVVEEQLLENAKPVSIQVKDASIEEVLAVCLQNQALTYSIVGKTIVLKEKVEVAVAAYAAPPPRMVDLYGIVQDEKTLDVLVGATVTLKGTKKSTFTNAHGGFRMQVDADKPVILEVSFVGYETREITVKAGGAQLISLAVSTRSINEMVVTGVFTRNKANFTGASSSYSAEDLAKVSNNNVLTALKVLDPSFQLPENINLGSNPNALPEVVLRGGNSLVDPGQSGTANPFGYANSPNTPLFILDGFEVSLQRISDLDMNRIAKVDILKDAAATAIYGSRAANGVIVIETIRPRDGKLRFTYSGNAVVESADLSGYNLLNASEKLALEKKAGAYTSIVNGSQNNLNILYNARLADVQRGVNTNWIAQPVQTGFGHKHNIYLEGGGNSALYGINATFDQRTGVMKGSDRRTISASSYLSYRVSNFQFRNDLTLNFNNAHNSPYGSFTQYARLNPYWTPYDDNGQLKPFLEDVRDLSGNHIGNRDAYDNLDGQGPGRAANPLYNASLNIKDQTAYQNVVNNFSLQWQASQWLRLTARVAYQTQTDESDKFLPGQHTSFSRKTTFEKGSYTRGDGKRNSLEGMLTADANKRIGKHLLFATVGMNAQQVKSQTRSYMVQGFSNPSLDQLVLGNRFPDGSKPTGTESLSRLFGVLSNVSYAYDSRYLLDLSYRLDGSSQFGSDKRFAPFWSIGTGWNLHNEAILKGVKAINRLKLRYSFGYTGSQNFPSYLGLTTSQYYTDQEYRGVIGTYLLGYGNNSLLWQKTQKNNIGVDLTAFNWLDVTANYFIEKTQGSIATISTPPSTGFNSFSENLGNVTGRGWEAFIRANIIAKPRSRDNWSVFLNLFSVKSRIEKISDKLAAMNKRADTSLVTRPITRYAEGQSTSAIWAVRSLGIDPANGQEIFLSKDGKIVSNYNTLDQVINGDTRPDVEGTFGTNLELKGVGVNMAFRFRYGGQAYNQTLIERVEAVDVAYYNVDQRVANGRWTKPGDQTFFKALYTSGGYPIQTFSSSRFVQDDNSLSCESISLYYRFSDALNKKFGLQNTKVTLFSNEVFRFSTIKRERGLDYPFSRIFTLQLQTTF
jgi:TonB-linked SusC/RagA family outer membrane protein